MQSLANELCLLTVLQGVPEPMNEYALYSHAVNLSLSGIAMLMLLKDHCSARK